MTASPHYSNDNAKFITSRHTTTAHTPHSHDCYSPTTKLSYHITRCPLAHPIGAPGPGALTAAATAFHKISLLDMWLCCDAKPNSPLPCWRRKVVRLAER